LHWVYSLVLYFKMRNDMLKEVAYKTIPVMAMSFLVSWLLLFMGLPSWFLSLIFAVIITGLVLQNKRWMTRLR